ncbi:hypothetical protein EMCRGX_G024977 [Ephydatia muelleri]
MDVKAQWEVACQLQTAADFADFLAGIDVWIRRPHVVNKRVVGASILQERAVPKDSGSDRPVTGDHLDHASSRQLLRELIPRGGGPSVKELVTIDEDNGTCLFSSLAASGPLAIPGGGYLIRYHFSGPGEQARVTLAIPMAGDRGDGVSYTADGVVAPTVTWLADVLLPRIVRWAEGNRDLAGKCNRDPLVPLDKFCLLYRQLKEKYGPFFVQNWPETTDPHKFVYEDIAIATYLLLLWQEERDTLRLKQKQSFVDLGCGNGLLVHLLSSEGHPGKGIDLRARKVWSLYGSSTQLEVCSLTPSSGTSFSEYDWLIGNHSDELTPWIPVMAARSSYAAKYFVLPCCPYDFDKKFSRVGSAQSQYRYYLDYVRTIGTVMGFEVEEDVMRIPSNKRVCHVGRRRVYQPNDEGDIDAKRKEFIDSRSSCAGVASPPSSTHCLESSYSDVASQECVVDNACLCGRERVVSASGSCDGMKGCVSSDSCEGVRGCGVSGEPWLATFKPRPSKERTRNGSRIDPKIKSLIVNTVAFKLLSEENYVDIPVLEASHSTESELTGSGGRRCWNVGGKLHLNDVALLFDVDVLFHLKEEFGGLQTVFRNHRQVFKVIDSHVQIRDWWKDDGTKRPSHKGKIIRDQKAVEQSTKTKECWFHAHHPQGCPRQASVCTYAHGTTELRTF